MIEGHKAAGAVTSELGAELARKKAEAYGLGFVTVRNSNHHGTCAYWGLQMAQRDMIAFVASNTPPFLAAPVSKQGVPTSWLEYSKIAGVFFCPIEDELPHAEFGVAYRTDKRNPVMIAFLQIINQASFNI